MRNVAATVTRPSALLLLAAAGLVHAAFVTSAVPAEPNKASKAAGVPAGSTTARPGPRPGMVAPGASPIELPPAVRDMTDAIMSAVQAGRIEELATAVDWNEMKPDLSPDGPVGDPIGYWKAQSADGQGRSVLAVFGNLLETRPATLAGGKDVENNRVFVWPGFADKPLGKLTPGEDVELFRLVSAADAAAMKAKGRYSGWRLAIGADGTWHSFRKVD